MASLAIPIIEALGGKKVLGKAANVEDLPNLLRGGLPYESLEHIAASYGLSQPDLALLLHRSMRSIQRWQQTRAPLDIEVSNLLYRLVRTIVLARYVLGDYDKALAWLKKPNRALGGAIPLRMIDTDPGAQLVEDVISRIDYGGIS